MKDALARAAKEFSDAADHLIDTKDNLARLFGIQSSQDTTGESDMRDAFRTLAVLRETENAVENARALVCVVCPQPLAPAKAPEVKAEDGEIIPVAFRDESDESYAKRVIAAIWGV